jgi:hypothetical protein
MDGVPVIIFCTLNDIYVSRPRLALEASSLYIRFKWTYHRYTIIKCAE